MVRVVLEILGLIIALCLIDVIWVFVANWFGRWNERRADARISEILKKTSQTLKETEDNV